MPVHLERTLLSMLDAEDENQTAAAIARAPKPPNLEIIEGGNTGAATPARPPPAPTQSDQPLAWMTQGACNGLNADLWFSDHHDTRSRASDVTTAKTICGTCPVQAACLGYSLDNREEFGIWGGVGPRERRRMLNAHRRR